ncbi:GAF domain-containing sensor histidine kinase [Streptomyces gobiensis]|uniref:sensor histidine kinase n=1 Tax=Streptomyces gobiensis TaxID=2875706 RepID=UPI001E486560|nr:GAF domain-containing protein [Streptomyces gobiensis]UGY92508.1 GAF domain-containing protein [Streptomyces gobiensis]
MAVPFPERHETGSFAALRAAQSLQGLSPEIARRLPQLLEAMVSIGTDVGLRTILDRIAETAAELTGAGCAAIGVLSPDGTELAEFITHGVGVGVGVGIDEATRERTGRPPDGWAGLLGAVAREGEPVLVPDVAADPRFAGFPAGHPPTRSFLGVPIRVQGEPFGSLYLADKRDGGPFSVGDLHMVRVVATEAGIAIGHARLHESARQRSRWINGSAALTTSLLQGDGHDALEVVAEQARQLADAAAGVVLMPTEEGGLEIAAAAGEDPAGLVGTRVPPDSPVTAHLLAGEPVFVDDSATDPRMTTKVASRFGPSMLLPLNSGGRVLGTLALPRAPGAPRFTTTERTLAQQFASQAALALVLTEAQRDRERLAVYEDRDRIARDLHDLVIQRLFATGMLLEGAQRRAMIPEVREGVSKAVEELDTTIQEIRTAIFALQQGPAEAPSSLRTRVLREIGMVALPLGFQPSATFTGPVDARVSELTARNLVAAVREALSNAIRHAEASRIEVTVDATAVLADGRDAVRLTVADDGVGVPAGGRRSGLRNLRRRAEELGGSSRWGPGIGEHGGGTAVVWEVPV